jgi:hypothetical protein
MTTYPAGQVTVRGVEVPVFTDDGGRWVAWIAGDGQEVTAETRPALEAELGRALRAATANVAVPFLTLRTGPGDTPVAVAGTATGIHSGNHNILVTWADGARDQLGMSGSDKIVRGDADPAEWERLRAAYLAASKALYAFEQANRLDLRAAVRRALRAAVAGETGE